MNYIDNAAIRYVIAEDGSRWYLAKDALKALGINLNAAPVCAYLRGLPSADWRRIAREDACEVWHFPPLSHPPYVVSQRGLKALQKHYAGRVLELEEVA